MQRTKTYNLSMAALLLPLLLAFFARPGLAAQSASEKELGPKALKIVVSDVKSSDSDVREQAVLVLGEAGNKAAEGMLRDMLNDRDKYVRIAAARALWELGSPAGMKTVRAIIDDVPAQGPIPVTNDPLVQLRIISQNSIREKAIEAYAWMRGEKGADLLYKLKNDAYGPIRDTAARELARLGHDDELSTFINALSDQDEAVRFEAATVLSKICHPAGAGPLAKLAAGDDSVRVRMAALDALACSPAKRDAEDVLLKLADDNNPTIRYKAIAALGGIRDAKVKTKLFQISQDSKDIRVRIAAQKALMLCGAQPDVSVVRDAMTAASPDIRLAALDVAASFPEDEALPIFAQGLDDPDTKVKLAAALRVLRLAGRS